MRKYLIIMFLLFFEIFLFLSCNSKGDNKVSINWVDLYGIETVDFDENPINIVYYTLKGSNGNYNKRNLLLNPNIDKNIIIKEKDVRNLSVWCSTSGLGCYIYPNIQLTENKQIEIYLFKDLLPDDNNKLIFMKHEQVLGYTYDFREFRKNDCFFYTIISKNNIMDLNLNNIKERTDIDIVIKPPEYIIENLTKDEVVYFYYQSPLPNLIQEYPDNFCTYYVRSKIDKKILRLNKVEYFVDKGFKMRSTDFK